MILMPWRSLPLHAGAALREADDDLDRLAVEARRDGVAEAAHERERGRVAERDGRLQPQDPLAAGERRDLRREAPAHAASLPRVDDLERHLRLGHVPLADEARDPD